MLRFSLRDRTSRGPEESSFEEETRTKSTNRPLDSENLGKAAARKIPNIFRLHWYISHNAVAFLC